MSVIPIVQLNDHELFQHEVSLRRPCRRVEQFDAELTILVENLLDTLMAHKIAIGLAAPQIGSDLRVAVVSLDRNPASALVLCNPEVVTATGKKKIGRESCMSVPGLGAPVERRERIEIRYQTPQGEVESLVASGFLARVVAHEVDHLNGYLYLDHVVDRSTIKPVGIFNQD